MLACCLVVVLVCALVGLESVGSLKYGFDGSSAHCSVDVIGCWHWRCVFGVRYVVLLFCK